MKKDHSLGFLFKQIHDSFEADINRQLHRQDLTLSQMGVLHYLFKNPNDTVTHKDIEHFLKLKHSTVAGILARMGKKGFVTSAIDEKDRRRRNIFPTDLAFEVKANMEQCRLDMNDRLVQGMSEDDVENLTVLLKKVLENMSES